MSKNYLHAKVFIAFMYLMSAFIAYSTLNPVHAAGQTVTITPNSISASGTGTEVTYSYTSSAEFSIGTAVYITAPAGVTIANCTTPTSDADGDSTPDAGSTGISGQSYYYFFSTDTTTATTTGVSFCVALNSNTAGNYAISFTDTKSDPANNDYGAALLYIGDANDVTVSAQVQPTLSFVIRNSADDADTNVCNLGVLNPASVNECSYRLKVGTNADSGYVVSVVTDGDLSRNGTGDVADADDLDIVADEGGAIAAGTEAYGIQLTGNQTSVGATITESSTAGFNYSTDDSPLPLPADGVKTLYSSSSANNPTTTTHSALVTHRATIDTGTNTGNYQQIVTYTVTANF